MVSQLEQGISAALLTVREWMNTLAPINRFPPEILCLISTHLSSHQDRFRASSVCGYWRRTFLQRGALWSELFLENGEDYMTTLFERAKGSALDITVNGLVPLGTITLLSPYAQKIRRLSFPDNRWTNILKFLRVVCGPLPLLHTLEIYITDLGNQLNQLNLLTFPPSPLFCGAINLEEFVLDLRWGGSLNHFVFPTLTTLKLLTPQMDEFDASDLFDFLRASPMLRTVEVVNRGGFISGSIPHDMVVVLPNVETFFLSAEDDTRDAYELAVHISCPRAKYTSLVNENGMTPGVEVFPDSASWVAISRQYTTSPVEEVTLQIDHHKPEVLIACSLTFRSSDATVIELVSQVTYEEEPLMCCGKIFSQACRTIRGHPLLSHVKRLHLKDGTTSFGVGIVVPMVDVVRELFRSLVPLDEFTIHGFDLRIFLASFIDLPDFRHLERVFPPVKVLTISETLMFNKRGCEDGIAELTKSQRKLGKPFERVMVHGREADEVEVLRSMRGIWP